MFNNLIESSPHTREFKRRGSFFLFTIGAYALLFAVAGVASIYAYDAHLDEETTEVVIMLPPVDLPGPKREPDHTVDASRQRNREQIPDQRREPIASINHPELALPPISTNPNPFLPVRDHTQTFIGGTDQNGSGPLVPVGPGVAATGASPSGVTIVRDLGTPPPPAPAPTPKKIVIASKILNGVAIYLPKPPYPAIAKQIHLSGSVSVQVLIDETGRVVSAHAVSGHPLLAAGAVQAAHQARFSPTIVGDSPVKLSGIITYNFLLQ